MTKASMKEASGGLQLRLDFVRPSHARKEEGASDLLQVPTELGFGDHTDAHWCNTIDLAETNDIPLSLRQMGFSQLDLSRSSSLQSELEAVRKAGKISAANAAQIRSNIQGKSFYLKEGGRLKILFVAGEGLIMRSSGPNKLVVDPEVKMTELNGHRAADKVHGDQNVYGTPIKQMLKGFAPYLFRHQTRGRRSRLAPLYLLNLWIPLQQCTQPLSLADRRTVNACAQQVSFKLPTDDFLDRNADQKLNDIWLFLHNERQQWYCDSSMDSNSAYVFDTLGAPHGAGTFPGEDIAEQYFQLLRKLVNNAAAGDASLFDEALNAPLPVSEHTLPMSCPKSLVEATESVSSLVSEAKAGGLGEVMKSDWMNRAETAMQALVRKSIEMRVVAIPLL